MSLIFTAVAAIILFWLYQRWRKQQRRAQLLASPLNAVQQEIIAGRFPLYVRLPETLRAGLAGQINLFLDQITFIGCDGLEVTQEMRLTIAAQACLLVLNREDRWYQTLRTILVYPGAFKSRQTETDGYVETVRENIRIGESWERGPVVLSWAHAERGAFIDNDGHNVVLHEFAHQLDEQSGASDGAPLLDRDHDHHGWATVFRNAYERLTQAVEAGDTPFLDPYGATAPAEFFAVAVEYFFEKPAALKREEPDLYKQLTLYFELDPIDWQ